MKILVLLAIVPLTVGDVFTIRTLEKSISDDTPLLRVCFDGHIENISNSSEFKLQISNNFTQIVVPSISLACEQCQMFKINIADYAGPTNFMLALQGRQGGKDEILARGSVTVTLKNINFTGMWVGQTREGFGGRSVRVHHDYKASRREKLSASLLGLDTKETFKCKTSPCYLIDARKDQIYGEVELCLSNVASTDTKGCQVCERKVPENFMADLPEPDSLVLTYPEDRKPFITVSGPFDNATASLELVLYRGEGKSYHLVSAPCDVTINGGSKVCKSPNIVKQLNPGQYEVLLVALNQNGKVLHSLISSFENFGTKVTQLSSDLIEVEWKAAEEDVYEVSLDQDVPGGYNNISVHCGGLDSSSCSVYFMNLEQKTYEVKVKRNESARNAITKFTTIAKEIHEHLKVFSVLHSIPDAMESRTNLTVCVEETIDSHTYDLILIDHWGTTVRTKDTLKGLYILCFPPVTIPSSFDTSHKIRILIQAEIKRQSFHGDSELFLMGLNRSDGNKRLTVDQVGRRTARIKWLNLNDGPVAIGNVFTLTQDIIAHYVNRISCNYKDECGKYLHFVNKTVTFQITEMAEPMQIIHASMYFVDIPSIKIISSAIDSDGRVKVCFNEVKGAHRYEMGLELDHSSMIDDARHPETIRSGEREICLLSGIKVDAGQDSSINAIVSGLDINGTLVAAGNEVLKVNFISSSQDVLAVSTEEGIMASWAHMVGLGDDEEYQVSFKYLGTSGKTPTDVEVADKQVIRQLSEEERGDLAVCVQPKDTAPKAFNGQACSDIIHFSNVRVLQYLTVKEMKLWATSQDSIWVTWNPPSPDEEMSSYVVSWKQDYIPDYDRLPAAEGLLYILPPILDSEEFIIVPQEQISLSLRNLVESSKYVVCVAAAIGGIMGHKTCGEVDLDSYYSLAYPTNVEYEEGIVTWNCELNCTCHVEWKSFIDGTSNHMEVYGSSYRLALGPGVWQVAVRNITAGVASGPSKIRVSVEGIVILARQIGQSSLLIKWKENEEMPLMKAYDTALEYEVTFSKNGKPLDSATAIKCSGWMDDCSFQFTNNHISPGHEISITVLSLNSSNSAEVFHRIKRVREIRSLSVTMRESDYAKVTWGKVYEAARYNYVLHDRQNPKSIRLSGSQPDNSLEINIPDLEGCIFSVQVCISANTCGDFTTVTLRTSNGIKIDITYILGLFIGGLAFIILLLITFAFRKKTP
ncbi:uncharacterized protein [Palaemon carinicauda]